MTAREGADRYDEGRYRLEQRVGCCKTQDLLVHRPEASQHDPSAHPPRGNIPVRVVARLIVGLDRPRSRHRGSSRRVRFWVATQAIKLHPMWLI
jgi:hypothetical protein